MGARRVSSEHVENMEMFSCSPTLIGALWFSENLIRYSLHITFVDVWIKIFIARLFREVKNSFFPSDTLIYGIYREGSKNFNIRTCEHMFLGQLTMGARQAKNAPLVGRLDPAHKSTICSQRESAWAPTGGGTYVAWLGEPAPRTSSGFPKKKSGANFV